jgi:hypothetical protein
MNEINKIILELASLQAALLVNANAYDDDLEDTWNALKEDYERVKKSLDKFIEKRD